MDEPIDLHLSRRERQMMDIVYARGEASVVDIVRELPDPPTRNAVRTMLRILEDKGYLRHSKRGREFIFQPTTPRKRAAQSALRRVLETFFEGSLQNAVVVHLSDPKSEVSADELKHLAALIREARKKEK